MRATLWGALTGIVLVVLGIAWFSTGEDRMTALGAACGLVLAAVVAEIARHLVRRRPRRG